MLTWVQRELRHFTPWYKHRKVEQHSLPGMIRRITGQVSVSLRNERVTGAERCWSSEIDLGVRR